MVLGYRVFLAEALALTLTHCQRLRILLCRVSSSQASRSEFCMSNSVRLGVHWKHFEAWLLACAPKLQASTWLAAAKGTSNSLILPLCLNFVGTDLSCVRGLQLWLGTDFCSYPCRP